MIQVVLLSISFFFSPLLVQKISAAEETEVEEVAENESSPEQEEKPSEETPSKETPSKEKSSEETPALGFELLWGVGYGALKSKENTWGREAFSDLNLRYSLGDDFIFGSMKPYALFRYVGMSLSPEISEADELSHYRGVVLAYLFGAGLKIPLSKLLEGDVQVALGPAFTNLSNMSQAKSKKETAFLVDIGGGVGLNLSETWKVHSRVHIQLGSYFVWQVLLGSSFAI